MVQSALEAQKIIAQVSAIATFDETFKARLVSEPVSVLKEHGLELTADMPSMKVEVLSSYDEIPADAALGSTLYLVVPSADELSHEDLSMVVGAAASCQSTASTFCTVPSCISSSSTASTNSCS